MRILGVDPGLGATGYGIVDVLVKPVQQIKLLEAGTIEPKAREDLAGKLNKIYSNLNDILDQYKPDVMILEKLYAHYKHPTTACVMGHARGVIVLLSAQKRMRMIEESVKRIRKALVGNGNANKQQTREVVAHILKIDPQKMPLDASDALALALGYAHIVRYG